GDWDDDSVTARTASAVAWRGSTPSARRHLDLKTVAPAGRDAFVRLAPIDHRVGEPDAPADQDHEADQQHEVRQRAVPLVVVRIAPGARLRVCHSDLRPQ